MTHLESVDASLNTSPLPEETEAGSSPEEIASPSPEKAPDGAAPDKAAQVAALEEELDQARDELLRALADLDNLRKRSIREQEEARKYAVTQFARDILSVLDNLERALAALPSETADSHTQTIREGVALVHQELVSLLGRHHIHKIPALQEKFDPHVHQAMLEIETQEQTPGIVIQVLQDGYKLSDRLLRPALVAVSKAVPKASSCEEVEV